MLLEVDGLKGLVELLQLLAAQAHLLEVGFQVLYDLRARHELIHAV